MGQGGHAGGVIPKIVISAIEHDSVFETAEDLAQDGVEVVVIPVGGNGIIDLQKFEDAIDERTALVSVMYVNNETGIIQPISKIADIIRNFRNSKYEPLNFKHVQGKTSEIQNKSSVMSSQMSIVGTMYPLFHTDASQGFPFFDCNVDALGVDLMTLSGHKMYGPKGVGALYVREIAEILPIITGGGQEFGLRSGTENTAAIVGTGEAVRIAEKARVNDAKRISELRDYFWKKLKTAVPNAELNAGVKSGEVSHAHAPHILNVYFPSREAQDIVTYLDTKGVAVSAGPACSSRAVRPSRVLMALGHSRARALRSARFSFGKHTTKEELDRTIDILRGFI